MGRWGGVHYSAWWPGGRQGRVRGGSELWSGTGSVVPQRQESRGGGAWRNTGPTDDWQSCCTGRRRAKGARLLGLLAHGSCAGYGAGLPAARVAWWSGVEGVHAGRAVVRQEELLDLLGLLQRLELLHWTSEGSGAFCEATCVGTTGNSGTLLRLCHSGIVTRMRLLSVVSWRCLGSGDLRGQPCTPLRGLHMVVGVRRCKTPAREAVGNLQLRR